MDKEADAERDSQKRHHRWDSPEKLKQWNTHINEQTGRSLLEELSHVGIKVWKSQPSHLQAGNLGTKAWGSVWVQRPENRGYETWLMKAGRPRILMAKGRTVAHVYENQIYFFLGLFYRASQPIDRTHTH